MPPFPFPFLQRTCAYNVLCPNGIQIPLPSISPSHLPLHQNRCQSCGLQWSQRDREMAIMERPFILPCDHLIGSRCLALGFKGGVVWCEECGGDVRVLGEEVGAGNEVTDGSELSSALSSPVWPVAGEPVVAAGVGVSVSDGENGMSQSGRPIPSRVRQKMSFDFLLNGGVASLQNNASSTSAVTDTIGISNDATPVNRPGSSSSAATATTTQTTSPGHSPQLPTRGDIVDYTIQFTPINGPLRRTQAHRFDNAHQISPDESPITLASHGSASTNDTSPETLPSVGSSSASAFSTDDEDAHLPFVRRRVQRTLPNELTIDRTSNIISDDEDAHLPFVRRRVQRTLSNELPIGRTSNIISDRRIASEIQDTERRRSGRRSDGRLLYDTRYHPIDDFLSPER